MVTWMLFVNMFLAWGMSDNAIFVRDAGRVPFWHNAVQRVTRFRALWVLIGLLVGIIGILLTKSILVVLVPPLVVFALALATALGPAIMEERTKLSWEPLLTVPYDMRAIVLGKATGALWHIRSLVYAMGILLMCVSAAVGTLGLTVVPMGIVRIGHWYGPGLCGVLVFMPVLGSLLFMIDRIQQHTLMAVAALASGTTVSSVRSALSTATAAVLLAWIAESAAAVVFLTLDHEGWQPGFASVLSLVTLGPTVSYVAHMDLDRAVVLIVGTLLLREVIIGGLWRWTLRKAQI